MSGNSRLRRSVVLTLLIGAFATAQTVRAEDPPAGDAEQTERDELPSFLKGATVGPATASMSDIAEIDVEKGLLWVDGDRTREFLEMSENPSSGSEVGMLYSLEGGWFTLFEWEDCGYVKDDDHGKLDHDAMLKSIGEGIKAGNEARKSRGWEPLRLVGWSPAPRYDTATRRLEWGVKVASSGGASVNYNTRVLGRRGVMHVNLVAEPKELDELIPRFHGLLSAYRFKEGGRYDQFTSGDKVAEYGLAALIVGGAAAAGLKFGILQKFWKLIVVGVLAVVGFVGNLFKKLLGRGDAADDAA